MSTAPAYPKLIDAIDELRRRWRLRKVAEGGLLALAGTLGALVAAVAADNVIRPGTAGRLVLDSALWGTVAAAVLRWVVRRWRDDRRDDYFAALVERQHPELHNRLINALQLGRVHHPGSSPQLVGRIVEDAAGDLADLDLADSLDARPARRAAAVAGAAGALLMIYALTLTPWFCNGLARVLLPSAAIPPYTATRVLDASVRLGNARVPEGSSVTIRARVDGVIPPSAELLRHPGAGPWLSSPMAPDRKSADLFAARVPQAVESFEYQVVAGDGRSATYRVEVVKRPRVERLAPTYTPPAYAAKPPCHVPDSDGEIAGLAGTSVVVELKATRPLREASFVTEQGAVIPLSRAGRADSWSASFLIGSRDVRAVPEMTPGGLPVSRRAPPASPPPQPSPTRGEGADHPLSPLVGEGRGGGDAPSEAAAQSSRTAPGRWINGPTRYQIKLLDTDGYESADPLWRSIAATGDQAPGVTITGPGRDLQIEPGAVVPVTVETRDDYGVGPVRLVYRVNDEAEVHELAAFRHDGPPALQTNDRFAWTVSGPGLRPGAVVQYWAVAEDRNTVTGPGRSESRRVALFLTTPEQAVARLDVGVADYARMLEALARLQRENRAQTASGGPFDTLIKRQVLVRTKTGQLARAMERDALPVRTIVGELDDLAAGLMADAVRLFEAGRDAAGPAQAEEARGRSLPVQDRIIARLGALLARLQRNEQARDALRKMARADRAGHQATTRVLGQMIKDLGRLTAAQQERAGTFEALPKKPVDEFQGESPEAARERDDLLKAWEKWARGTVAELAKLPAGFVDDFQLRPNVNKVFEEIEAAACRPRAVKVEVALEDLGASLATQMLEDLEMWMPDAPDALKWVLEEPLDKKPMQVPEMPLPTALDDMVGDLLQKADEFDEEAEDVTSAWGDNLNQAGWAVSDGPISSFSAKGKTGNDLPNDMEVSGRSGDGRRGKSSGQMVGDAARGLDGRKTPARVNNERNEPGRLRQEGRSDPNGATGGGKKSGSGRRGLQGGTPPDFVRDMGRLAEQQAGLRDRAEQVARRLETSGLHRRRLADSIALMKSAEQDLRDLRYQDAARKRREALGRLRAAFTGRDPATAAQLGRARDLPPPLRAELLQAADEGYPAGYEALLKSYFKALSAAEK